VIYEVIWESAAVNAAAGFLVDDGAGLADVLDAAGSLAEDPRPAAALRLGGPHRLRLHLGRYRLWYEVDDQIGMVTVVRCGRTA